MKKRDKRGEVSSDVAGRGSVIDSSLNKGQENSLIEESVVPHRRVERGST